MTSTTTIQKEDNLIKVNTIFNLNEEISSFRNIIFAGRYKKLNFGKVDTQPYQYWKLDDPNQLTKNYFNILNYYFSLLKEKNWNKLDDFIIDSLTPQWTFSQTKRQYNYSCYNLILKTIFENIIKQPHSIVLFDELKEKYLIKNTNDVLNFLEQRPSLFKILNEVYNSIKYTFKERLIELILDYHKDPEEYNELLFISISTDLRIDKSVQLMDEFYHNYWFKLSGNIREIIGINLYNTEIL